MRKMLRTLAALVLVLNVGCATQTVKYSLRDVAPAGSVQFNNKTLAVKSFVNQRPTPEELNTKGTGPGVVTVEDGSKWFFNSDENYKSDLLVMIPKMIAAHIDASGLFKSAKFNGNANYTLEGTIKNFDSYKKIDSRTATGKYFGLIGTLTTAGIESEYSACVLIQARLSDSRGNVVWSGNVESKLKGSDYADIYGWSAYTKANEALKEATNKLIRELEKQ